MCVQRSPIGSRGAAGKGGDSLTLLAVQMAMRGDVMAGACRMASILKSNFLGTSPANSSEIVSTDTVGKGAGCGAALM